MKLAAVIQRLCDQKGWSLSRLAKEAKVPVSNLHGWKTGRKTVNIEQLKAVATALAVPLHDLCFDEPDPCRDSRKETKLEQIFHGDVRVTIHRFNGGLG